MRSLTIPTLYKYLPSSGANALLTDRCLWFRCPLQFEPWDCRADLLENLDVTQVRAVYRQELAQLLCGRTQPTAPFQPEGILLQMLRMRKRPWTPAEVEAAFGDIADGLFNDIDEYRERVRKEQEVILQDVRVLCLCENNASPEMWSDYADKGDGACIGFRYVPEIDNALGAVKQVEYADKWPPIATPLEWARHVLFLERIPFEERTGRSLYVKQRKFAHEQEWRVITKPTPGTKADADGVFRVTIDAPEIVEVILGPALSAKTETILREAVRVFSPHATIRRAAIELSESTK